MSCEAGGKVTPGEEEVPITSGGVERSYLRNVPVSYRARRPMPIVVQLHGLGQQNSVAGFARGTRLESYGNKHGFMTLLPIALPVGYFQPS